MAAVGVYDDPGPFVGEALLPLFLRKLLLVLPNYVACIDSKRRLLFINRTLSRELPDIVGKPIDEYVAIPNREAVIAAIDRAFVTKERQLIEYDATAEETLRHLQAQILPFDALDGRELALVITSDETERRRLTLELERSEEFRRRVVENLPDYVSLLDREHRFIWVNRLAPGLTAADVIGAKIETFLTPESTAATCGAIDAAFASGTMSQCEAEGYRDAKSMRWVLNRVVPILVNGQVDATLLITSDLSELKQAERALREKEEQLHHAQRLESIGQLAGGIAHDFNNLLQVIDGNLHFIREGLLDGEDVSEELTQALQATRAAADLTSRLLAVGRRKRIDLSRVDLGALAAANLRGLRAAGPDSIQIVFEPPSEACFVELDAAEFEQVLSNLCLNARDAMRGSGILRIGVKPDGAEHVVLSVKDDGVGIPPEHLTRIFEPFFATKGAGSGLGLAVAAGIVAAHGGVLSAESDGVRGTLMKVRLPRTRGERREAQPTLGVAQGRATTILVAEDEPQVRAQVVRILQRAGHNVLEVENGARAIEVFRAKHLEIDLVVLDAIMPLCNGWQAYLEIARVKPGIKALFTTGYAANVLPSDFASRGARLLSKPFKPSELLDKVRELINTAATRPSDPP